MVLVWTTHARVGTKGKVGAINWQSLGVKRITARRERRAVFRTQVEVFLVLSGIGEGVATYHGCVVSLLGMLMEGGLDVVGSPGDVSPGRILAAILMMVKVGHVPADGIGVVELLHERTRQSLDLAGKRE